MKKKPLMSYSAMSTWKTCGDLYYWKYKRRVRPKEEGSSLAFGSAVDVSLTYLLEHKKDDQEEIGLASYKDVFLTAKRGWNNAFDNNRLRYRKADYDLNVLQSSDDVTLIAKWEDELGATTSAAIKAEKISKAVPFRGQKLKLFNRLCWLSLKRKGNLMLKAFERDVYPNILKVIAVQHKIEGDVGDVARAGGYLDLICMYKGYEEPVVFDIKTSASFYEDHSVQFSHQLQLYLAVVGPELKTDKAGYIVLLKFMKKDEQCTKCNFAKASKHRTCNNTISGLRCGGTWKGIPKGHTQVIINPVSKEKQESALQDLSSISVLATQNLRWKNYDACFKYGMCDMFHLCHFGDKSKYNFPKEEKDESER